MPCQDGELAALGLNLESFQKYWQVEHDDCRPELFLKQAQASLHLLKRVVDL